MSKTSYSNQFELNVYAWWYRNTVEWPTEHSTLSSPSIKPHCTKQVCLTVQMYESKHEATHCVNASVLLFPPPFSPTMLLTLSFPQIKHAE